MTSFNDALGNVNVAPGFIKTARTTDVELLASEEAFSQDGVTLAVGQGVLDVGTPLYRFDDGTYGKFAGQPNVVVAPSVTFTDAGDLVTTPTAHGLAVGDKVSVASVTTTTGITAATTYYVKTAPSSTTLTLSATSGGSTLALTTNGTGGALSHVHDVDDVANSLVGFLRRQTYTGVAGSIPKFGLRVYRGTLKYSVIKAANGGTDLSGGQLTAVGARIDTNRDYLIF